MTYSTGHYASAPYAGLLAEPSIPALLAHRLAYDADGTRVMVIDDGLIDPVGLSPIQRAGLNDEIDVGVVSPDSLVGSPGSGVLLVFPDAMRLEAVYLAGDFQIFTVEVSLDTTNGQDGSWQAVSGPVTTAGSVGDEYRGVVPLETSYEPVRALRVRQDGVGGSINALHVYGAYLDNADRLMFWSADENRRLEPTQWTTGLDGESQITFRIHNLSDRAAEDVMLSIESLSDFPLTDWSRIAYADDPETEYEALYLGRIEGRSNSPNLLLTTTIQAPATPETQSARLHAEVERDEPSALWSGSAGEPPPAELTIATSTVVTDYEGEWTPRNSAVMSDSRVVVVDPVTPWTMHLINPVTGAVVTETVPDDGLLGEVTDVVRLSDLHFIVTSIAGTEGRIEVWTIGNDLFTKVFSETYSSNSAHDLVAARAFPSFVDSERGEYTFVVVSIEREDEVTSFADTKIGSRTFLAVLDATPNEVVWLRDPTVPTTLSGDQWDHNGEGLLLDVAATMDFDDTLDNGPTLGIFFAWMDARNDGTYNVMYMVERWQTNHTVTMVGSGSPIETSTVAPGSNPFGRMDRSRIAVSHRVGSGKQMGLVRPRLDARTYSFVNEHGHEITVDSGWHLDLSRIYVTDGGGALYHGVPMYWGQPKTEDDPGVGPATYEDLTAPLVSPVFDGAHILLPIVRFMSDFSSEIMDLVFIDEPPDDNYAGVPVPVGFEEDVITPSADGSYWYISDMFVLPNGTPVVVYMGAVTRLIHLDYTLG